jgi:hypothetical protein
MPLTHRARQRRHLVSTYQRDNIAVVIIYLPLRFNQ